MLTLTSAREGNAPTGYILSGSCDGENWEVIDERSKKSRNSNGKDIQDHLK